MSENIGDYKLQLTGEQIDAALDAVHNEKVVRNDKSQTLTDEQKAQARENIGAIDEERIGQTDEVVAEVEAMIGNVETGAASKNYAVGEFLVKDDKFYKVTSAIASGETITEGTNVVETEVTDVLKELDDRKANTEGRYEDLISGLTEQLETKISEENQDPYNFRTAGGGLEIGDREYIDKIVGGTVAWNQRVNNGNFVDRTGWSFLPSSGATVSYANNAALLTFTGEGSTGNGRIYKTIPKIGKDHVIMICGSFLASVNTQNTCFTLYSTETGQIYTPTASVPANKWTDVCKITKITSALETTPRIYVFPNKESMSTGDTYSIKNVMVFDLTQMFGTDIADYVYALETANTGAGVAWFRALFPADYYAYDAGTLRSVNAAAHRTVGFNAWDEEWELGAINASGEKVPSNDLIRSKNYIPIIPGTTYYANLSGKNARIAFYDAGMAFISYVDKTGNGTFTTPENACYMLFRMNTAYGTTYGHNLCFNLHWDGERDGEYEPYSAHTYALDDALTLRGVPKLDANNALYYDGDEYTPDGTVTRKYNEITFDGSDDETWSLDFQNLRNGFTGNLPTTTQAGSSGTQMITSRIDVSSSSSSTVADENRITCRGVQGSVGSNRFYIYAPPSVIADVTTLRAWLAANPLTVVYYESVSKTTEAAAPYTSPQIVDNFGTEEYTDAGVEAETRDVAIPVGHITEYPINLRAKIEAAPDSPSADGNYAMKRDNSQNSYIPLSSTSELIGIENRKADKDGTIAFSKQLVSTVGIEDESPYNFRTTGGNADVGDYSDINKIIGGTVVWNQIIVDGNFPTGATGWSAANCTLTFSDNIGHMAIPANDSSETAKRIGQSVSLTSGHKYLRKLKLKSSLELGLKTYAGASGAALPIVSITPAPDTWVTIADIVNCGSTGSFTFLIGRIGVIPEGGMTVDVKDVMLIDLTQMFGEITADHIYALETANAGGGVAWFNRLFPANYYAYNTGTLQSVKAATHKMIGFNAFDASTADDGHVYSLNGRRQSTTSGSCQMIRVIPNATYYIKSPRTANFYNIVYFDAEGNGLNDGARVAANGTGKTFTTPAECGYVGVNTLTADKGIVCLNLSWDGERDGGYEPYESHTYTLDDTLTLYGVPGLDANNNLVYDGDEYEPDGTVTRRYGIVDLGTLTWTMSQSVTSRFSSGTISNAYQGSSSELTHGVCVKYLPSTSAKIQTTTPIDKTFAIQTSSTPVVFVYDTDFTDAVSFKAAMSGVYIIYELAEPTVETADPYESRQLINDFGTEEFVDAGVVASERDVSIPVGHETVYAPNLRAKLEMAPNSPDGDGLYLVKCEDGINTYIAYTKELPASSSEDGTYTLKCTVADGTATYSWVADT